MATTTRKTVRREAASQLGTYTLITAASGSTTQVVVNALIDSGESDYRYVGQWALATAGTAGNLAKVRRVISYTAQSGTLGFPTGNGAWPSSIVASDEFELHDLISPGDWNLCVTRALRRCTRTRREQITAVLNQLQYSLSSYTDLEQPDHLVKVWHRIGDTADQYLWRELFDSDWQVSADDGVFTLNLDYGLSTGSQDAYFIEYIGPYANLSDDTTTTTCPLDWLVAGVIHQAYELFGKRIEQAERSAVRIDREQAAQEFLRQTMIWAPEVAYPVSAQGW